MPITKSAQKQLKKSRERRLRNRQAKSSLKTAIKKVRGGLAGRDAEATRTALEQALPLMDKAAAKGIIHKNAAARYKSRLTRQFHSLSRSS